MAVIIPYPRKIMTIVDRMEAGTPVLIKSRVRRYGFPVWSSIIMADMLGYPETGNPKKIQTNAISF
jgi:hypothetical protein